MNKKKTTESEDRAQAWFDKYYGEPDFETMTKVELIEHALNKWKGLRPEVLKKHGLRLGESKKLLSEDSSTVLEISCNSCSLCQRYKCVHIAANTDRKDCPLAMFLGRPCDGTTLDPPFTHPPFAYWCHIGDPEPMISALQETLDRAKSEASNCARL